MNCADCLELISGHIDGQNTVAEEAQLQAHLAECAECREILAAYEQIGLDAVSLTAEPPAELVSAVMDRVGQQAGGVPAKKKKKFPFGHGTAFAAAAAVLVILIGTGLVELPGRNFAKTESAFDASVAESEAVKNSTSMFAADAPAALVLQTDAAETVQAQPEIGAVNEEDAALYDSAADYNAVFDALGSAAAEGENGTLQQDTAGDSIAMPETPAPNGPAEYPEAETERTEEKTSEFAVYAEVYDYSASLAAGEPIEELSGLTQSETDANTYFGTAAEILLIVERYANTHSIGCSVASGYADDDAACIVIFE